MYCVIDLECTCWTQEDPEKSFHETIEIGAVLLDDKLQIKAEFQSFVRPLYNRKLSEYCKDLTTITQEQVDNAPSFEDALRLFKGWLHVHTKEPIFNTTLVSWGNFDRSQLEEDCDRNNCRYLIFHQHYNLKEGFSKFKNKPKKKFGLAKAARLCGVHFEGTHHRALDDTKVATKIFQLIWMNPLI